MKHSTASPAIYALHKMSHNMAPTHQRTARKSLATVLSKRKLPTPKGVAPLLTFPLGHATFQAELRRFLRECISKHRDQTIPFHPPSTKVVFRRHPQIQQVLHNWRNAHHQWIADQPPPCACQHLHTSHYPHLFHGHIAAPLSELLPDQHSLKFSGKSTLFPKVSQLHTQQVRAIQRWHKRNQLPSPPTDDPILTTFVHQQIQQHLASTDGHINIHIIVTLSSKYSINFQPALSTAKITTPTACSGFVQHYTTPPSQALSPIQAFSPFHTLHPLPCTWKRSNNSGTCSPATKNTLGIGVRSLVPMSFQNARNSSKKDAPLLPLCNPQPRHSGKPFPTCSELYAGKLAPTPSDKVMPPASCVSSRHSFSKQLTTTKHTSCTTRTWQDSSHP